MGLKKVQVPIGMISSYAYPITGEPAGAHPTYGTKKDMGAAVKGTLGVTTSVFDLPGDDEILIHDEAYVSHQVDVETTLDDLDINSFLFGHSLLEGIEDSNKDDKPPFIAYAYIEPLLKKDKSRVYRATFFRKMSALQSSEKTESDTKGTTLQYKNKAVSLFGQVDNTGSWRARKEFSTLDAAEAWLDLCAGVTGKHLVELQLIGAGSADKPAAGMAAAGESYVITFSTAPSKVYDRTGTGVTDITAQLSGKVLTLTALAGNHSITAIFA